MKYINQLVLILTIFISGCSSIVETRRLTNATLPTQQGQFYMLPKGLVPVRVLESAGNFRVEILDPIIVGDPHYQFSLSYSSSSLSSDTAKMVIDTKTSLLKTITLQSKDETAEILKKLAASFAVAESAEVQETVLFQGLFEPEIPNATAAM